MVFAYDPKSAQRWRNRQQRKLHPDRPVGLTGAALEQAVMAIATRDPGLVAMKAA